MLKFGSILGGSVGDMGGVFTALQAFSKQSKFLQSFDLSQEEKEKKIQDLRFSKHKKGVSEREKDRRMKYGTEMAEESFLRKKGKKKNELSEKESYNLGDAKLDARIKSDQLSYEELDRMDTQTEDFLEDEEIDQTKISEIDEMIQEETKKKTYQLKDPQAKRVKQAMDKKLSDERRIRRRVERRRLQEEEDEQEFLNDDDERKILQPGRTKPRKPMMKIEDATVSQSETNSRRFIPTGNRSQTNSRTLENNKNNMGIENVNNNEGISMIGGAKKKEPEFTLRNEVVNDKQLRRELDKFSENIKITCLNLISH